MPPLIEQRRFLALVTGPILWSVYFVFVYGFLSVGCRLRLHDMTFLQINLVSLLLLLATLATLALLVWRSWALWRQPGPFRDLSGEQTGQDDSPGFMRTVALSLYALSFMGTLWVGLPVLMLGPCE